MNKTFISLFFIIFIIYTSITYSMEIDSIKVFTSSKSYLFHKRKKINVTNQDISQSLCLNTQHEIIQKRIWKNIPLKSPHTKEDIKKFTNILHKPASYNQFLDKEYSDALAIAEKFKCLLLYNDLFFIDAKLPKETMTLIKQKILYLYLKEKVHIAIPNIIEFNRKENPTLDYSNWPNPIITLYNLIKKATLIQTIMLMLMCNRAIFSQKTMIITPHMAGFSALNLWNEENLAFICAHLSAKIKTKEADDKKYIQKFSFNI